MSHHPKGCIPAVFSPATPIRIGMAVGSRTIVGVPLCVCGTSLSCSIPPLAIHPRKGVLASGLASYQNKPRKNLVCSGHEHFSQSKPSSRVAYSDKTLVQVQAPLFMGESPKKRMSKREMFRRRREERRRLFETRLPFQCGLVLPARKPLVYTPMEDGSWREDYSGRVISHERLQQYLVRYGFI